MEYQACSKIMRPFPSFLLILVCVLFAACQNNDYAPKPRGYFNIEFPEKGYQTYLSDCPFIFEYPKYALVEPDMDLNARPCWINMQFPQFKGTLHLSYQPVTSNRVFHKLVEDARTFAFKHTIKATSIDEGIIHYPDRKVYGILYKIEGNAASSIQFFLTDSTKHYLRGALYFNEEPKLDSIQPVLNFVREDIDRLIKTIKWKN